MAAPGLHRAVVTSGTRHRFSLQQQHRQERGGQQGCMTISPTDIRLFMGDTRCSDTCRQVSYAWRTVARDSFDVMLLLGSLLPADPQCRIADVAVSRGSQGVFTSLAVDLPLLPPSMLLQNVCVWCRTVHAPSSVTHSLFQICHRCDLQLFQRRCRKQLLHKVWTAQACRTAGACNIEYTGPLNGASPQAVAHASCAGPGAHMILL